ncbi:hypothetical protein Poly51_62740 [Rubripirellula tenax]|uniref:Uncharacterized protein n=1 Tax=Rubripirellula tenax TaxID=2528015 RepID=A0A5C6E8R0_9BACT|nr:hypothetical protein Poly51_62740 [Rubripirellula tenax]
MTSRQPLFQLATEAPWSESEPPWQWPTLDLPPFTHFPISIRLTDDAIGSLVASLCDPLDLKPQTNSHLILEELASLDSYCLRGGLRITLGDEAIISHGCCCGLEDWRELFSVLDRESPWTPPTASKQVEAKNDVPWRRDAMIWESKMRGSRVTMTRIHSNSTRHIARIVTDIVHLESRSQLQAPAWWNIHPLVPHNHKGPGGVHRVDGPFDQIFPGLN